MITRCATRNNHQLPLVLLSSFSYCVTNQHTHTALTQIDKQPYGYKLEPLALHRHPLPQTHIPKTQIASSRIPKNPSDRTCFAIEIRLRWYPPTRSELAYHIVVGLPITDHLDWLSAKLARRWTIDTLDTRMLSHCRMGQSQRIWDARALSLRLAQEVYPVLVGTTVAKSCPTSRRTARPRLQLLDQGQAVTSPPPDCSPGATPRRSLNHQDPF